MTDSRDGAWKSCFFVSHTSREESCTGVIKKRKAGPLSQAEQDRDRTVKDGSVSGVLGCR